jgi:uncharacterized protein involved in response to NO
MVFGFIAAAIAGFLLTAVPSWTGDRGFAGQALVWLAVLWLLARVAFAGASVLPLWLLTLSELSFLPVLVLLLAPPLTRARNRNTPLLAVLGALWISDAVFLIALSRHEPTLAVRALHVAIDVILTLVTVIGGRIVPSFTFRKSCVPRRELSDLGTRPGGGGRRALRCEHFRAAIGEPSTNWRVSRTWARPDPQNTSM